MTRAVFLHILITSAFVSTLACADDAPPAPLKAVMYVGGCCHDYKKTPAMLAEKIAELANITIDIRLMNTAEEMKAAFHDPKFGQGFDVIIYDICFGEKWKDGDYDPALKVAADGKPAVFIHCAMHTYRAPRDVSAPDFMERDAIVDQKWHALAGMDTRVHDKYAPFSTTKVARDHPILKTFPDNWKTAGDELYNTVKLMPTATPLLQAKSAASGKTHTVAWVNHYGKSAVFGTTLGHDGKTCDDPDYHKLLASGLLWVCDKLSADGKPLAGYAGR